MELEVLDDFRAGSRKGRRNGNSAARFSQDWTVLTMPVMCFALFLTKLKIPQLQHDPALANHSYTFLSHPFQLAPNALLSS